jgi:ATP-dependent RNA helicase RhlE
VKFASLGLDEPILRGVTAAGFDQPTEIQERVIPAAMKGKDLIALAETGSGKTAAYGLPILNRLNGGEAGLRALILVPTRELCVQVADNLRIYARYTDMHVCTAFGGINIGIQEAAFRRGLDVLVACPGRLIDHLQCGNFDLDRVETLVLDEADRMLDMGFMPQIRRILARLPAKRQNFLLSATMPKEIESLVSNNFGETEQIQVGSRSQAAETITHRFESILAPKKEPFLERMLEKREGSVLIFVKTKLRAEQLGRQLKRAGLPAESIHGDKSAESRHVVLQAFSRGKTRFMVATDVAARGIDVSDIGLVVNFDMPRAMEDYIHRVGRTGRAGNEGEALTLVTRMDKGILNQILNHMQKSSEGQGRIIVDGKQIAGPKGGGKKAGRSKDKERSSDGREEKKTRGRDKDRDRRAPAENGKAKKEPRSKRVAGREVTLSSRSLEPPHLASDVLFGDVPHEEPVAESASPKKARSRPRKSGRKR